MVKYRLFFDSDNGTIGVVVDDGNTLSIGEYNRLADKERPSVMELIQLLLNCCPETIADFKHHLVLVDDPEWDIREQLIFTRSDGGEDIIQHSYKADRADADMKTELLPGISYRQLFENTLSYNPVKFKSSNPTIKATEKEDSFVISSPNKFSVNALVRAMKMNPIITLMLIVGIITLGSGIVIFQSPPETIILAPDRLQQAAQVDQKLNNLKVEVDDLWHKLDRHKLLPTKDKKLYWAKLKPLNIQYRALRRSGFGHGNKFKVINTTLKKIRDRLRPKNKAKRVNVPNKKPA